MRGWTFDPRELAEPIKQQITDTDAELERAEIELTDAKNRVARLRRRTDALRHMALHLGLTINTIVEDSAYIDEGE